MVGWWCSQSHAGSDVGGRGGWCQGADEAVGRGVLGDVEETSEGLVISGVGVIKGDGDGVGCRWGCGCRGGMRWEGCSSRGRGR